MAVSALALSTGAAAQAAPATTVVDPGVAVAIAGDGTNAAWLHADYGPNGGSPTKITLWTRDGAGVAKAVDQALPKTTSDLAVGTDAKGRLTVVLNSGGTSRSGPTTLYALPFDGSAKPKKLRASSPGGAESAPGLRRGVLSFTRDERTRARGKVHATVRLGSLTSSNSRLVWDGAPDTEIYSTAPTAQDGVGFVTGRTYADREGVSYGLRVLRAGKASKLLSKTGFGGASAAGFGPLVTTDGGSRLVATRWCDDGGGHPNDRTTYRAPSGTQVGSAKKLTAGGYQDVAVPVQGGTLYVDHQADPDGSDLGPLVFAPNG